MISGMVNGGVGGGGGRCADVKTDIDGAVQYLSIFLVN